jgi:hypothetical protein
MALQHRPDIETLALTIAYSPIVIARVVTERRLHCARQPGEAVSENALPEGFEDVDLAILRWIADEGRRVGRTLAKI